MKSIAYLMFTAVLLLTLTGCAAFEKRKGVTGPRQTLVQDKTYDDKSSGGGIPDDIILSGQSSDDMSAPSGVAPMDDTLRNAAARPADMAEYLSDGSVHVYSLDAPRESLPPLYGGGLSPALTPPAGVPSTHDPNVTVFSLSDGGGVPVPMQGVPDIMPPSATQDDFRSPFAADGPAASGLMPMPRSPQGS